MMLLSQTVYAEIDPIVLSNTFDAFKAIRAIANQVRSTSTSKISSDLLSPTAEQRVAIINAITGGSSDHSDAMQKVIFSAQSPIQSVLEAASCVESNRIISANFSPFVGKFSFTSAKSSTQKTIVNRCADVVRVDRWTMPTSEVIEFTAMFRPLQTEQVNTWRFKMKRQLSGFWVLGSLENISFKN